MFFGFFEIDKAGLISIKNELFCSDKSKFITEIMNILRGDIMSRNIRNSAKVLVIKDGKMLAIKLKDSDGEWYIMPGGGQDAEELLSSAACREVAEEMGILAECKELLFVVEGLHGEKFHRVDFVFLCEYIGEIPNAVINRDTNQIGYDWLDISTLNIQPLYPSKLRRQIMNYYESKPYQVYLGNEDSGDPECLD